MSRLNFEVVNLEMSEQCFPRIYFMKSRIRRIIPRMKRILDFVFDQPSEGIKRLRSDAEECDQIEKSVSDKTVNVNIMYTDKDLASQLSPKTLAIEKKYVTEVKTPKSKLNEARRGDAHVVLIESSRLQDLTKIKDNRPLNDAIIAVFVNNESSCPMYDWITERETLHQFALIYPRVSQPIASHYVSSETVPSTHKSEFDIRRRTSPRIHPERPISPPSSPINRSSPPRSPSRKIGIARPSPAKLPHSPGIHCPSLPRLRRQSTSPEKQLPETLSPKSRPNSPKFMPNVKRSKRELDNVQASTSPMEVDENEASSIDTPSEPAAPVTYTRDNNGFKKLQECVQFQLEVKTVQTTEQILRLLTDVKNRRDASARVSTVTVLDKLIYEVEGLLSLSNTNHGKELRKKFDNPTNDSSLREELFRINGFHGCGNFYHRMCIHIEPGDEIVKDEVKRNIKETMKKYNFTENDYDTYVVQSEQTRGGGLVLCQA